MYTLDYKLPFSTIALICEADYIAKIHFNFTYVSFLSLGVDWTNLFGRNVSGEFTTGTRAQTHAHAHARAHAHAHAGKRMRARLKYKVVGKMNSAKDYTYTHIHPHTHFGVKT